MVFFFSAAIATAVIGIATAVISIATIEGARLGDCQLGKDHLRLACLVLRGLTPNELVIEDLLYFPLLAYKDLLCLFRPCFADAGGPFDQWRDHQHRHRCLNHRPYLHHRRTQTILFQALEQPSKPGHCCQNPP